LGRGQRWFESSILDMYFIKKIDPNPDGYQFVIYKRINEFYSYCIQFAWNYQEARQELKMFQELQDELSFEKVVEQLKAKPYLTKLLIYTNE
jgi:hypothetical protein